MQVAPRCANDEVPESVAVHVTHIHPRDARTDEDYYEVIGDDSGVFGCMSLLACHDVWRSQVRTGLR